MSATPSSSTPANRGRRDVGRHAPRETQSAYVTPDLQSNEEYVTSDLQSDEDESGISFLSHPEGDVEITGGHFNAVGGHQLSFHVTLNGPQSERRQRCNTVSRASDQADVDYVECNPDYVEKVGSHALPSHCSVPIPEDSERSTSRVVQQVNEEPYAIYFRCLATRGRGSPLWIPEPNKELPVEYQRNGLVLGDVGIITDQGCFDSLFNISLPPDDRLAINTDILPKNFSPLEITHRDRLKSSKFKKGASLSSGSVSVTVDDLSGLIFESSASEGALLTLPDGSSSEDLRNQKILRDYLAVHLEEIYRCALIEHGREINNGDLRIVTGFDKTTTWGMAAFLNSTSQRKPSFSLEFRTKDPGCVGQTYSWKSSGMAEVKAGPDTQEVIALRMGDPSQQDIEYNNQGVFVRTQNASLNPTIWNALLKESGAGEPQLDDNSDTHSDSASPPSGNGHSLGTGNSTNEIGHQSAIYGSASYSLSSINTLAMHPSNGINAMLLQLNPSAQMAISGDDIWISVLEDDDAVLPSMETLWSRILESYDIRLEDGVVFLKKLHTQAEVSPIRQEPATDAQATEVSSSPHVPSLKSLINCSTLNGLELDTNLRDQAAPDTTGVASPDRDFHNRPFDTPRQLCSRITEADNTSALSQQISSPLSLSFSPKPSLSKRPRLDAMDISFPTPAPGSNIRQGSGPKHIGIVSTADRGPSSGSLLSRDRHEQESQSPCQSPHTQNQQPEDEGDAVRIQAAVKSPNIDLCSPHVPALRPLINRLTLKELELDVILRNPAIRHDLLFDPDLQFRPRRKREIFERYWNAVWEEVQTGCTCLTLDVQGNLHHTKICICSRFPHSSRNMAEQFKAEGGKVIYSLRMPSRIPALLLEVLEVMVFVIQPLSNTAVYTDPNAIREQAQEHSAHAAYLRSIFDPALIAQELKHKVFDPSGLFVRIGQTLKHHCAPMRDRAVEEMVQMAQRPGPEAFKAVRACLELLELMKLDIANHQVKQLRPWLLRNTGIFEVKAFKIRFGNNPSLHNTRMWLDGAHNALLERKAPIPHPSYPAGCIRYIELRRNHQIYLSVLKGIIDLIFDIQEAHPFASLSNNSNTNSNFVSSLAPNLFPLPETLYLDKSRLLHLRTEAVNTTALYMFTLLFRQLVFSSDRPSRPHPYRRNAKAIKVSQDDMAWLKREIRDIGPMCLGTCFENDHEGKSDDVGVGVSTIVRESDNIGNTQNNDNKKRKKDSEQIQSSKQNLVLQIAMRASDIRKQRQFPSSSPSLLSSSSSSSFSSSTLISDSDPDCKARIGLEVPDPGLLAIAQRWTNTNMKLGSALTRLLHKRMRDAVFDAVVSVAYPGKDATQAAVSAGRSLGVDWAGNGILAGMGLGEPEPHPQAYLPVTQTVGMESMTDEIQRLAVDIARLALIHLNTHLPLYESQGFVPGRTVSTVDVSRNTMEENHNYVEENRKVTCLPHHPRLGRNSSKVRALGPIVACPGAIWTFGGDQNNAFLGPGP